MRPRDVMSLIKQSAPLLSMEAYEEEDRPLGVAIESAARDETCVWHRVGSVASSSDNPDTCILYLAVHARLSVLLSQTTRKPPGSCQEAVPAFVAPR